MRIDLNNTAASQIANENSTQVPGKTSSPKTPHAEDTATLSTDTVSISSLSTQALASPKVRQEKVDALRQSISDGTYKVDVKQTADAIVRDNRK